MTNANVEKERRKKEKKHCPVWRCELAFSLFAWKIDRKQESNVS